MKPPSRFLLQLKRIDKSLSVSWDNRIGRWKLLRKNPVKTNLKPELVRVWYEPTNKPWGRYLPLDNRLLSWLVENDMDRKFYGRDRRFFGMLMEQELNAQEASGIASRDKRYEEMHAEVMERGLLPAIRKDLGFGRKLVGGFWKKGKAAKA